MVLASLAAAALIAVGLGIYWRPAGQTIAKNQLEEAAPRWYEDVPRVAGWNSAGDRAPAAFKFPAAMIGQPARWRDFQTQYGPAVVYDYSLPGRQPAYLFVVRTPHEFAGIRPNPYTVLTSSGRLAMGAWQSGGMLYVLVIDRDRQRLDDHVRRLPEA
jgi:hypothetical protein